MDIRKVLISALTIIIIIIFYYLNFFNFLETKAYDLLLLFKYLLSPTRVNEIVIVKIDNDFLREVGKWPLKRSFYGEAIEQLNSEGARAIGIDVSFAAESPDVIEDKALAETLAKYNNVVLPVEMKLKLVRGLNYEVLEVVDVIKPLETLAENAVTGHINFIPDRDGVIRKLPVTFKLNQREYHSFSYQLTYTAGYKISEFRDKNIILNFLGPSGTIPWVSLKDLFEGNYLPGFFKDKIVLIGVDVSGLGDKFMTPFSRYGFLTGVELHGQAIYNLIHGNYLRPLPFKYNVILLISVMVFFAYVFYRFTPFISRKIMFFFLFLLLGVDLFLFYNSNFLLPLTTPMVAVGLLYVVSLIQWYLSSEKERSRVIDIFERYISEDLVNELIKSQEPLKLGGDRVELSVLFLDIRGFTGYAEEELPEKVVGELNQAFEAISGIIFMHKGTLDKYLGDGLMAFFGAPVFLPDHRERSLKAALEILKLKLPFKLGIGINTGQVVIGNIGSLKRMDYTVIGDTVNKAFRFVELAAPGEVIIGENTFSGLPVRTREMDWEREKVTLKGSRQEIVIYRLSKEGVSG